MHRKKLDKKVRAPRVVKKNDVTILRSATADMLPRLTPAIMRQTRRPQQP